MQFGPVSGAKRPRMSARVLKTKEKIDVHRGRGDGSHQRKEEGNQEDGGVAHIGGDKGN